MSATIIMLIAVLLYVLVRWSKNESAVTIGAVVSGAFVIGVIALLDRGRTAEIARGFAWLFLVVVAYNFIPAIARALKTGAGAAKSNFSSTLGPNTQ